VFSYVLLKGKQHQEVIQTSLFSLFADIQDFLQFSHFNIFFGILSFFGVCWLSASAISWLDTWCDTCHRLSKSHTKVLKHVYKTIWSYIGSFDQTTEYLERLYRLQKDFILLLDWCPLRSIQCMYHQGHHIRHGLHQSYQSFRTIIVSEWMAIQKFVLIGFLQKMHIM